MKLQHSFFAVQALLAILSATPSLAQQLTIDEFADSFAQLGYTEFAKLLRIDQQVLQRLAEGDSYDRTGLSVAIPEGNQPPPLDSSSRKRQAGAVQRGSYQMSNPANLPKKRGYYEKKQPDIPTGVRESWLEDPRVVNLGCDIGQATVNKGSGRDVDVSVGLGKTVKSTGKTVTFKYGIIYEVDSWFTIPEDFSSTAPEVGVDEFLKLAKKQGVVDQLDDTTSITIFAPLNVYKGMNVLDYVVPDTVAYSPQLSVGTYIAISGAKIVISKDKDGSFKVNGNKIKQEDVIIKNGVMHTFKNKKVYKGYNKGYNKGYKAKRGDYEEPETTTECETTTAPVYETTTPVYTPPAPVYTPETTPVYEPETTPVYTPPAPVYTPETTPVYEPETTPVYTPPAPVYTPETTPVYEPETTPVYTPPAPVYTPETTPVYEPETTPVYETTTPVYTPPAPVYTPETTPVYEPEPTPVYEPSTPVYTPPVDTPVYEPTTPVYETPVYTPPVDTPVYEPTTPVYETPVYTPPAPVYTPPAYVNTTTPEVPVYTPSSTGSAPVESGNSTTSPTFSATPVPSAPVDAGASGLRVQVAALVAGAVGVLAFLL